MPSKKTSKETGGHFFLKLSYSDPIEAQTFADAITGISNIYKRGSGGPENSGHHELCISKVREGSIEIDFTVIGPGLLASIEAIKHIPKYLKYVKSALDFFQKKSPSEIAQNFESNEIGDFSRVLQVVAKDSDGQMTIANNHIENLTVNINLNSSSARKIIHNLDTAKSLKKMPLAKSSEKVALYFKRTSDRVTQQRSGDRVVIESISLNPVKVEFSNSKIKAEILGINENIFNKVFIVDVHIETVEKEPVLYKIIRLHSIEDRPKPIKKKVTRNR